MDSTSGAGATPPLPGSQSGKQTKNKKRVKHRSRTVKAQDEAKTALPESKKPEVQDPRLHGLAEWRKNTAYLKELGFPNTPVAEQESLVVLEKAIEVAEFHAMHPGNGTTYIQSVLNLGTYFSQYHWTHHNKKRMKEERLLLERLGSLLISAMKNAEGKSEFIKSRKSFLDPINFLTRSGYDISPELAFKMCTATSHYVSSINGMSFDHYIIETNSDITSYLIDALTIGQNDQHRPKSTISKQSLSDTYHDLVKHFEKLIDCDFRLFSSDLTTQLSRFIDSPLFSQLLSSQQQIQMHMLLARGYHIIVEEDLSIPKQARNEYARLGIRHLIEAQEIGLPPDLEQEARITHTHLLGIQGKTGQLQKQLELSEQDGSLYCHHALLFARLGLVGSPALNLPPSPVVALKRWLKNTPQAKPTWYERVRFPSPAKSGLIDDTLENYWGFSALESCKNNKFTGETTLTIRKLDDTNTFSANIVEAILLIKTGEPAMAMNMLTLEVENSADPVASHLAAYLIITNQVSGYTKEKTEELLCLAIKGGNTSAALDYARLVLKENRHKDALIVLEAAAKYFIKNQMHDELSECNELINSISIEDSQEPAQTEESFTHSEKKGITKRKKKRLKAKPKPTEKEPSSPKLLSPDLQGNESDTSDSGISLTSAPPSSSASTDSEDEKQAAAPQPPAPPIAVSTTPQKPEAASGKKEESFIATPVIKLQPVSLTQQALNEVNELVLDGEFDQAQALLNSLDSGQNKQLLARKFHMQAWLMRRRYDENDFKSIVNLSQKPSAQRHQVLEKARYSALQGLKILLPNVSPTELENDPAAAIDIETIPQPLKRTLASLFAELGHSWRRLSSHNFSSTGSEKAQALSCFADDLNPTQRRSRGLEKTLPATPKVGIVSQERAQQLRKDLKS